MKSKYYSIGPVKLIQKLQDAENVAKSKEIQKLYRDHQYKKDNYGF